MKKAKLKTTGKEVEVYRSSTANDGGKLENSIWIDYSDCKTTYKYSELIFIN